MPEPQSLAPTTAWIPGSRPGMTKTGEQSGTPNPQPERRHPAHASPRLPTHFPRAEAKQRYREPNTPSPPPHFVILGPDPGIHARTAIICTDNGMDTRLRAGHDENRSTGSTHPSALHDTLLTGVTRRRPSCARSSSPGFPGAASRRGPEPGFRCRGRWQRNPLPSWHASHARFPAR